MADEANPSEKPDAAASAHEPVSFDRVESARVRRAPKISVFLLAGAALGIVVALILTFAFDGTAEKSPFTGFEYSTGQVFGFLLLICIPVGLAIAGTIAVILDRRSSKHTREISVDHESLID